MPSFAVTADCHKALIQSRADAFVAPAEDIKPATARVSHAQW
jgi:hypothetical protein